MKNNKLFALSVAALLGLGTVGSFGIRAFQKQASVAGNEAFAESTKVDSVGTGISFGNHILRAGETDSVHSAIGVQLLDGATEGTKSVRFVAALTGYQGLSAAKWSRAAIIDGEETIKEAAEFEVTSVYTSVADFDSIKWSTAPSEDYTYYMVYTLANIPEAYDYSKIDVSFNTTDIAGTISAPTTQAANVKGLKGEGSVGVSFVASTVTPGEYYAYRYSTAITEAVIPEDHIKVEGYVATFLGKVTALDESAGKSGSTGAFENCSSLTKITLPKTIKSFDTWWFSRCKIVTLEFPEDLVDIGSYAFNSVTTIKTIEWNAKNLTTVTTPNLASKDVTIYVSGDVESLPTATIFGGTPAGNAAKIQYEGTEAEWAELEGDKENGLKVGYTVCSDTVTCQYTFHLNGGNIGGDESDVVSTAIVGKPVDMTKPLKENQVFAGWYTAAEGGEEFDITTNATGDKELYAHYEDLPAGVSLENPHILTAGDEFDVSFIPGMHVCYFEFTPTEDGHYILDGTYVFDAATSVGTTYSSPKWRSYDETGKASDVSSFSRTTVAAMQYYNSGSSATLNIDAKAGETYRFSFQLYYSTFYADYRGYGESSWKFTKSTDNDSAASATVLDMTAEVPGARHVLPKNGTSSFSYYKFTATETKDYYFNADLDGKTWGGIYMYEGAADGSFSTSKQLGYTYGTSTPSGAASIHCEEGKTYYILISYNSNNVNNDDTLYVGFTLGEPPAGGSLSKPATGVFSADGTALTATGALAGGTMNYYQVTIDHAGQYKLNYTKTSTYNQGKVGLYNADGTEIEVATSTSSGSGWSASYANSTDIVAELEAGTYIVAAGWNGSSWAGNFTIKMTEMLPGSEFGSALDCELTDGSAEVTTTLANTYYKVTLTKGAKLFSTTGDATSITVYNSSKTEVVKYTAGAAEEAYAVCDAGDYYIMVTGTGTSTITVAETAIRPDGKSRDTAYEIVRDENHRMDILQHATTATRTAWYKYNITKPGTYRIWTDSIQTGTSQDGKITGVYYGESTTTIKLKTAPDGDFTANNIDDNGTKYPEYCHHKYDAYAEFVVEEGSTGWYYFGIAMSAKNATVTSNELGIENIDPTAEEEGETTPDAPETPVEEEPGEETTTPGYVGTWTGEDGTITINANGTGSITEGDGIANFTYTIDADGDLSLTDFDGDDYYEGLVSWNEATGEFGAYVYGNESYFELETTKAPTTPEAPAYVGKTYTGKIGVNNQTLVFTSATECTWNGVSLSYTADGNSLKISEIFDEGIELTYNASNDSFSASYEVDFESYSGTLSLAA